MKPFTIRLEDELKTKLQKIAMEDERDLSSLIRKILGDYVREYSGTKRTTRRAKKSS